MSSFNSSSFPDSLALSKEGSMAIGSIDEIQKLHIRTVPLGEQPRRLAHQESSRTFAVLTSPSQGPTGASPALPRLRCSPTPAATLSCARTAPHPLIPRFSLSPKVMSRQQAAAAPLASPLHASTLPTEAAAWLSGCRSSAFSKVRAPPELFLMERGLVCRGG